MLYSQQELDPALSLREFLRLFLHVQVLPALAASEETLVGGQAVLEGVMMRAPHSYCVAVRRAGGEIVTDRKALPKVSDRYPIFKLPVFRGVGTLGQAMVLGIKALRFSANAALAEEQREKTPKEIPSWLLGLNLAVSLAFFIFLYKFVPLYLATALGKWSSVFRERIPFNVADGVIRVLIFVGFLWLISRMKDIRRVFEYHGAEHRVVFNFESGTPVTVEHAQRFSTFHPRCGTSFLLVVMIVSIAVYALLPFDSFLLKLAGRIALLPVVAGVSYEIIRFAAKRRQSLVAVMTAPGLWLQRITTKPPSDDQTAVAIHALEGAMDLEQAQGGEAMIA
jgi:uncharacterized protein YqhQ